MTSCFVYKVMGLTFHDRINTRLIYRIAVAQVVTRRITKPQRTFFRFESHWLLFFIHFFLIFSSFFFGRGRGRVFFFIFYPFNMYKVKTSVTTQTTVNYEIHVNVSVKRIFAMSKFVTRASKQQSDFAISR